jgi:hypothetical protein
MAAEPALLMETPQADLHAAIDLLHTIAVECGFRQVEGWPGAIDLHLLHAFQYDAEEGRQLIWFDPAKTPVSLVLHLQPALGSLEVVGLLLVFRFDYSGEERRTFLRLGLHRLIAGMQPRFVLADAADVCADMPIGAAIEAFRAFPYARWHYLRNTLPPDLEGKYHFT